MNDGADFGAELRDQRRVQYGADDQVDAVYAFQVLPATRREIVEDEDSPDSFVCTKRPAQVCSDEPGSAGYQDVRGQSRSTPSDLMRLRVSRTNDAFRATIS